MVEPLPEYGSLEWVKECFEIGHRLSKLMRLEEKGLQLDFTKMKRSSYAEAKIIYKSRNTDTNGYKQ